MVVVVAVAEEEDDGSTDTTTGIMGMEGTDKDFPKPRKDLVLLLLDNKEEDEDDDATGTELLLSGVEVAEAGKEETAVLGVVLGVSVTVMLVGAGDAFLRILEEVNFEKNDDEEEDFAEVFAARPTLLVVTAVASFG